MASAAAVRSDPSKSADVVMVGCKLPNGLVLELIEPGVTMQPNPTGTRVILKGANSLRERTDRLSHASYDYAVTPVDRSFWEQWMKRNAELDFVKKGFVFAADTLADAKAEAKEKQAERTGLEALAVEKDPRVSQIGRIGGSNVETDPEALSRAMASPA